MQDSAAAAGLAVDWVTVGPENCRGVFTDSYGEFLRGVYAKKNPRHYRTIGATRFGNEIVDESVGKRRKEDRDYEPQNDGLPPM